MKQLLAGQKEIIVKNVWHTSELYSLRVPFFHAVCC